MARERPTKPSGTVLGESSRQPTSCSLPGYRFEATNPSASGPYAVEYPALPSLSNGPMTLKARMGAMRVVIRCASGSCAWARAIWARSSSAVARASGRAADGARQIVSFQIARDVLAKLVEAKEVGKGAGGIGLGEDAGGERPGGVAGTVGRCDLGRRHLSGERGYGQGCEKQGDASRHQLSRRGNGDRGPRSQRLAAPPHSGID